jgi:hypothetical protein
MTFARFRLLALAVSACAGLTVAREAIADSVYLKNGARIDGKVTDNRTTSGKVVVTINETGFVTLRAGEVDRIEMGGGEAAAPAAVAGDDAAKAVRAMEKQRVAVTTANGDYYGNRTYEGTLSPESNEKTIVLEVPGPGKVYIPAGAKTVVTRMTAEEEAAMPKPAAATTESREIPTTYKIHLTNGETLMGDLIPTSDAEPVKLRVGRWGFTAIPRDKIAPNGIEKADGMIRLPEEPKAPAPGAEGAPPSAQQGEPMPPGAREELKREIRSELLREMLDQMIDEKLQQLYPAPPLQGAALEEDGDEEPLENDTILAIQDAVVELGRQRSTNRTRAERFLSEDAGSAALPYLVLPARHPFALTRRSVQRILRAIGDVRGAPLSIAALSDPDEFVRQLAHEALETLLPSSIAYDASGDAGQIREAQAQYQTLFDDTVRSHVRESVLREVALE